MLPRQKIAQSIRRSFIVATRSLAVTAAQPLEVVEDVLHQVKVTTLGNGVKVVSCDNGGHLSRMCIAVDAGSRKEDLDELGITHVLKNAAFIGNKASSFLNTIRTTQDLGASINVSNSRELETRNATFLREKLGSVLANTVPGVVAPLFQFWEFPGVEKFCNQDVAAMSPSAVNMELLHKVAFRNGLGNSVYCDPWKLGGILDRNSSKLEAFYSKNYVGSRMTVAGTNVYHDELVEHCSALFRGVQGGAVGAVPAQKYYGGDVQHNNSNGIAYASLFGAGAGLSSPDLPAFAVLQKLVGSGTQVKWGSNTVTSRLNRAASAVTELPFEISSLNISYSDTGLFGVHGAITAEAVKPVLSSIISVLGSLASGVSDEDLQRAKAQAVSSALMMGECGSDHLEDLVKQVVLGAASADLLSGIEGVSADKIVEISKQVLSKPTLVITGETTYAPYLDELI